MEFRLWRTNNSVDQYKHLAFDYLFYIFIGMRRQLSLNYTHNCAI